TVLDMLSLGGVGLTHLTEVYVILNAAGQSQISDQIRERMISVMDEAEKNPKIAGGALLQFTEVRIGIDSLQAAERLAEKAHHALPTDPAALFAFCLTMARSDNYDVARLNIQPVLDAVQNPVVVLASLVALLANLNRPDEALEMLGIADRLCTRP